MCVLGWICVFVGMVVINLKGLIMVVDLGSEVAEGWTPGCKSRRFVCTDAKNVT